MIKTSGECDSNTFQEPVRAEMSKTFWCLCCGTPPLTVNFSLPARGYVPGQSMPIKINVENQSNVVVNTVKLVLAKVRDVSFARETMVCQS